MIFNQMKYEKLTSSSRIFNFSRYELNQKANYELAKREFLFKSNQKR
jgi:hypothetical protein